MNKNDDQKIERDHKEIYHDDQHDVKKELEEARTKRDEYKDQLIRARSEIENQRKRFGKEIEKTRNFAIQDFVLKLLPAKDSMEQGYDIARAEAGIDTETVLEGIAATQRILNGIFRNAGLVEINPLGSVFNPELHEAISIKKTQNEESNRVVSVFQKGYLLNDRLIRPARVEVSGH